jgi:hypothetical protein
MAWAKPPILEALLISREPECRFVFLWGRFSTFGAKPPADMFSKLETFVVESKSLVYTDTGIHIFPGNGPVYQVPYRYYKVINFN